MESDTDGHLLEGALQNESHVKNVFTKLLSYPLGCRINFAKLHIKLCAMICEMFAYLAGDCEHPGIGASLTGHGD